MQLNSNLNFTRPWMFYLQTEAVLKASLFLNWRLQHCDTVFPELYSNDLNCLGRTVTKQINSVIFKLKRCFNICGNYS